MSFSERRAETERFLAALWGGAGRTADLGLFVLPGATSFRLPTSDLRSIAHEAIQASLEPGRNVYASCCLLTPESAAKGGRGTAEDATAMAGAWVDLDIAGPAHKSDSLPPSREAGVAILQAVDPAPTLIVDSGWGLYGWWLFPRPLSLMDPDERRLNERIEQGCQAAVRTIAARQGWSVDPTADFARVLRLPGTTNWKIAGDPKPVRVIHDSGMRYRRADLAGWADVIPETRPPAAPFEERIGAGFRTKSIESLAGRMRYWNESERAALAAALVHNDERCYPPLPSEKVKDTVAGIFRRYAPGVKPPRDLSTNGQAKSGSVVLGPYSEIEPKALEFIWEPGVIQGCLNLLAGDPGKGKGLITTSLVAAMTAGHSLPGNTPTPGKVLWISYEESEASAIRPRLDVAGADVARVYRLTVTREDGKPGRLFKPEDVPLLEEALVDNPDVRLLVLDPVLSFMRAGANINAGNDVRDSLDPLVELADRFGIAILGIAHINKSELSKILYRVSNSIAFVALARSVMAVGELEDKRRVLAHIKANYTPPFPPVPFNIVGMLHEATGQAVGRVAWDEPDAGIDVTRLFEDKKDEKTKDDEKANKCAVMILDLLDKGPQFSKEIKDQLFKAGFTETTIGRARRAAGVTVTGHGHGTRWHPPSFTPGEEEVSDHCPSPETTESDSRPPLHHPPKGDDPSISDGVEEGDA